MGNSSTTASLFTAESSIPQLRGEGATLSLDCPSRSSLGPPTAWKHTVSVGIGAREATVRPLGDSFLRAALSDYVQLQPDKRDTPRS